MQQAARSAVLRSKMGVLQTPKRFLLGRVLFSQNSRRRKEEAPYPGFLRACDYECAVRMQSALGRVDISRRNAIIDIEKESLPVRRLALRLCQENDRIPLDGGRSFSFAPNSPQ